MNWQTYISFLVAAALVSSVNCWGEDLSSNGGECTDRLEVKKKAHTNRSLLYSEELVSK